MRILLVEDEAPLRETLAARLKREGFAVDAAQDGEEGLYMGREVPFDVGIIDLGLPKMSGMELIKALRDEGKQFPVLILTARSSWQDKVDGLKQGADDYLVKPFHVEELLARINALVRRAAGWSKPTLECGAVVLDLAAQGLDQFHAGHLGQAQVDDAEVERDLATHVQALLAVLRGIDGKALALEARSQGFAEGSFVLDQKNAHGETPSAVRPLGRVHSG